MHYWLILEKDGRLATNRRTTDGDDDAPGEHLTDLLVHGIFAGKEVSLRCTGDSSFLLENNCTGNFVLERHKDGCLPSERNNAVPLSLPAAHSLPGRYSRLNLSHSEEKQNMK